MKLAKGDQCDTHLAKHGSKLDDHGRYLARGYSVRSKKYRIQNTDYYICKSWMLIFFRRPGRGGGGEKSPGQTLRKGNEWLILNDT